MVSLRSRILTLFAILLVHHHCTAATDTLKIMAYNVLYYGDTPPCQGPHSASHANLRTIINYAQPDVVGLEKMAAIPIYTGDTSGTAPAGFADSVLQFALNAATPITYAYCPYTNFSGADNMSVLFYNTAKLGFVNIVSSYNNITDFNTYKLYYKAADLATTHDTVFLYVTLNHDQSGGGSSSTTVRGEQIVGEMNQIATHFTQLPNMLNMGDFNTHNSSETCYQTLVSPTDTAYRFYDAPFFLDATYTYPADWDDNPATYTSSLTTSTRLSATVPNACGSSGGGKSWYDHIFISSHIAFNTEGLKYIHGSYNTLGNDGQRLDISINDAPANTAAPDSVVEALFQMSNKYPIMLSLEVNTNTTAVAAISTTIAGISVANPVGNNFLLRIPQALNGKEVTMECIDVAGNIVLQKNMIVNAGTMSIPCTLKSGAYFLKFTSGGEKIYQATVIKQ